MKRNLLLLGTTAALLLGSPAMGAVILTNHNFSTPDTDGDGVGWKIGPSGSIMFGVDGTSGVADSGVDNLEVASLYQQYSDTLESGVTFGFDFNLTTPGLRNMEFITYNGVTSDLGQYFRFRVLGDGSMSYNDNVGSEVAMTTTGTPFAMDTVGTYRFNLTLTNLDGVAGATGTLNGTVTRISDNASFGISASNSDWSSINAMEFVRFEVWDNQYAIDNVSVPEPSAALLGGLGLLGLLRRRRN